MVTAHTGTRVNHRSAIRTALRGLIVVAALCCVGFLAHIVLRDESGPPQQLYVFLIFALLALLAYGLTRRPAFSLGSVALLLLAIHALSSAKYDYLRAPMQIDDVLLVLRPEISDLLLHGYPDLAMTLIVALVAIGASGVAAFVLERPWPARWRRLSPAAVVVALAGLGVVIPGPGPLSLATVEATEPETANSNWDLISRFFASSLHTGIRRPVYAASPRPWMATDTATSPVVSVGRPDIVVVLEETTFNPQTVLPFCTPAICERPMLTGLPNSAAAGPLRAHVVGGLTWLSEFTLLTGLPHSLFGQAGQYAPVKVLPRVKYTLPRWLKTLGYRSIVVYPVDKHAFGGTVAYAMYGFDQVLTHPMVANGTRQGFWDLSDRELFDFVRELIAEEDAKPDRAPLFIFVLTLQQHGPHGTGLHGQPPRDDRPTFPAVDRELNAKLNDYLTRLDWSAVAISAFDAALARRGQPYILAHFGDHQPAFEGVLRAVPKRSPPAHVPADYLTYFNIQTGGGLLRAGHRLSATYPVLDLALLGGLILDVAGLPPNPYFAANIRLRERCDGLFTECADKDTLAAYQQYIFDELGTVAF